MSEKNQISINELNELSQYVCHQVVPSGSEDLDRKTMYFGIYWQLCILFEREVEQNNSSISAITDNLKNLFNDLSIEENISLNTIEKNINEIILEKYA